MQEEEDSGLESIIKKSEEFKVILEVEGAQKVVFLADFIDTDDPSAIDFYLDSRLVTSVSKSKFIMYQIRNVSEYNNSY